ncbi:MAG TPA: PAS domain S-box protein [Pyrinomonadaceae bacterium]|jgi:PAS domain S-box-containing protein|nr:PAS domain S-box protein [Pyrinomonadaceae bacterium]
MNPPAPHDQPKQSLACREAWPSFGESEKLLEAFINNAPIGIYRTTSDGGILLANPALLRMLGYPSFGELAARNLDEETFEPNYERSLFKAKLEREGEIRGLESEWTTRDGKAIFVREHARVVRGADEKVLYYEGTVEDITERKRYEAERQAILEIIQGVNTTANLDELLRLTHQSLGKLIYAENCFVALYDRADEMLRMRYFVDEHDATPPPQKLGRSCTAYVFRTGRPVLMTEDVFCALVEQGEVESVGTPPATWLGVPLRTPSEIIGVLVVQHYDDQHAYAARDLDFLISVGGQIALAIERQRAVEASQESEKRYRLMFESNPLPAWVYDLQTLSFLAVNESAVIHYGYSREEFLAMSVTDIRPAEDIPVFLEHVSAVVVGSNVVAAPSRHQTKDGQTIDVEISSRALFFDGRRAELVTANDVTERRIAEEKLKDFSVKLQQSNRELQDFASVASHDLQEPLRKVQAFGDRLKTKCGAALGDEGRDYIERMQSAARRMQNLINDLLTFSRVATKAQPFVRVDLAEVARGVLSDLEVRVEETGARVEVGEMMHIDADPLQMRQLLQNLLGNALKFRRLEEPPVVSVHCQPASHPTDEHSHAASAPGSELCQIVVSDNGIGFDEKYLDRIFTVFQRLHGRHEYEGTGVGLAVCRRIAERHGGSITARSAPGEGATFLVTLPIEHHEGGHYG